MADPATITPAAFKARYPEFAAVSDATIAAILVDAVAEVGPEWIDGDRVAAAMAWIADALMTHGFAPGGSGAPGAASPGLKRAKVGDVETEYHGAASGSGRGADATHARTPYAARFVELRARSFPAILGAV
jgi:hypothetical protein